MPKGEVWTECQMGESFLYYLNFSFLSSDSPLSACRLHTCLGGRGPGILPSARQEVAQGCLPYSQFFLFGYFSEYWLLAVPQNPCKVTRDYASLLRVWAQEEEDLCHDENHPTESSWACHVIGRVLGANPCLGDVIGSPYGSCFVS